MTHTYQVSGMTCGGCLAKVTSILNAQPDVLSANVNLETGETIVEMTKPITLSSFQTAFLGTKFQIIEAPKVQEMVVETAETQSWLATYKPLLIIFGYITATTLLVEFQNGGFNWMRWMTHFMAGFFLVFSFFKLLNLKAFANSYQMYDLVAKQIPFYGTLYPFIELGLGIAFLIGFNPFLTNLVTLIVMSVSIIGVIQSVRGKQKIQCACLGTVFNLPMSTVTIIEDLIMVAMSAAMLLAM